MGSRRPATAAGSGRRVRTPAGRSPACPGRGGYARRAAATAPSGGLLPLDLPAELLLPLPQLRGEGGAEIVVEITDGDGYYWRGHFLYDLVKTSVIRMAFGLAQELEGSGITAVAVTPGFLRSEWMLDHLGVTEANWRDAIAKVPEFAASETPLFVGRAIAALAADPHVARKSGRVFASWDLAEEYGFTDADGSRPHFLRWLREHMPQTAAAWRKCDDGFYAYWTKMPYGMPEG